MNMSEHLNQWVQLELCRAEAAVVIHARKRERVSEKASEGTSG